MSASSSHDQVHIKEPEDKTHLFESRTTSEGQGSASTSDMGQRVVAALMDNVVNPFMLFQLISASAEAMHAFKYQPIGYLKTSISCLPEEMGRLVVAYMVLVDKGPHTTPWPDLGYAWPRIPSPGYECSYCDSLLHDTWSSVFIERYLGPECRLPLERLSDPFSVLSKVARVFESIEQLSISNLWVWTPRVLMSLYRISLALWRIEIFCRLFGRDWSLRQNEIAGRAVTPTQEQHRFFHALDEDDIEDLYIVYDDLSIMLENVYSQELGHIFEAFYLWFTKGYNRELRSTEESLAVRSCVARFAGHIDYRMSLGMGYLYKIDKVRSPDIWPIDAQQHPRDGQWTNTFFTGALSGHVVMGSTYMHLELQRENRFHLQPVDDLHSEFWPRARFDSDVQRSANPAGWRLKLKYQRDFDPVFSVRRLRIPQPLFLDRTSNGDVGGSQVAK